MRKIMMIVAVASLVVVVSGMAQANMMELRFDPDDIFNYATTDDTRLNQQGTARYVGSTTLPPTGRYYQTYNDGTRDSGATAAADLQSVANILDWTATAGFQGVSHLQLWLSNAPSAPNWGETVVQIGYQDSLSASVNEYDWTVEIKENPWDADGDDPPYEPGTDQYGIVHYNTVLGGVGHQNALSPDFNPADGLWSVTGDFYVDVNANGQYDGGTDSDLVLGDYYTIWFYAAFNNWHCVDDVTYGNDAWGQFGMEGTIEAQAVPEPMSMVMLGSLGAGMFAARRMRRRKK